MNRRSLLACTRVFAKIQSIIIILVLVLFLGGLVSNLSASGLQLPAAPRGPKIWLGDNQAVPVKTVGASGLAQNVAAGQAQPVALATADVDADGIADLVAGFGTANGGMIVIHRGNLDAFAPQSKATFDAIGHGQFPSPFMASAQTMAVPVRPDFIATGRFTSSGFPDLAIASRGGNSVVLLAGDGKGKFTVFQTVQLSGGVTSMSAARLLRSESFDNVVVGIATPKTSALQVFTGSLMGLGSPANFPLEAPATNLLFGEFGDGHTDAAFLAGGKVFVLHSGTFQMEEISVPVNASAMAIGSFIFDRNSGTQFALLTSDGTLHIAAPMEFDPRPITMEEHQTRLHAARRGFGVPTDAPHVIPQNGWKLVESIASAAPFTPGQPPVLFRTRISDNSGDDVMVLNPSMSQLAVISHALPAQGATTFEPAKISTRPYNGVVAAAIPMRTNIDNRPGVVALHQGQFAPAVMMPLPDPTFFVNSIVDTTPGAVASTCNNVSNADTSSSCTLREAILKANATAGTDTIMLAANTYTLSIARQAGDNTGAHGGLYINDSVNIVGAGQASTIIQGGASAATGVDLVFAVNEDIQSVTNASASFQNLTIQFGHNRGSVAGTDGDGGCMEYDTGSSGNASLTLTNVTVQNCVTQDGNGGGLAIFNFEVPTGTGTATISNSIFQNNSVAEQGAGSTGSGGAIWASDKARLTLSNSQIKNNSANQVNGGGRGTSGGLFLFGAGPGESQIQIHSTIISGNSAAGEGGGIDSTRALLIDGTQASPTVISGNTAGANSGGVGGIGGGVYLDQATPDTATLTKVTITGNTSSGNGGGVAIGNDNPGAGPVTIHFSRLAGNTGAAGSNNLDNDRTTVNATANWWGTNTPSGTITNRNTGTTDISTFAKLTNTASPAVIKINTSSTLTGDLSKDNNGSAATFAGNLDVLIGLPITFNNAILGSIPQAQPEALNSSAQATATFNAGGTSGNGHADATVDQQTVTANVTIVEPLQITKSFNPTTVAVNASSTLTFAITNPNTIAVDASFTDTLPAGLVVAATPGVTNNCGGTVTATAGSGSISYSNATVAVGSCSITVKVSSATDNVYNNTVTINSTTAGTGAQSTSSASLTVINPPSIAKAFGAATIPLNGTTSLTFTITNSNVNSALNGLAFTDSLPAGLVVAPVPGLTNSCGGTATATTGASSVSLSGGALAAGANCTVVVNVQGTTAGVKNNSVTVSSTNGGTGNTSNASITVVGPPTISKSFGAASIPLNGSTSLSFTITNPNTTVALTGVAFSDTLPAGLVVSTPNGLTGTCGSGTITATAGSGTVSLSGGTIAANSSCTFSVNVTGTTAGAKANTTGAVSSTEGGTGATSNTATLNVVAPPSIAKAFNPTSIALNATTSLTFTITNPAANTVSLTGVAFTDTLPTGLTVASASATVCGGTLTTTAPTGIALTGATIAASGQCQFSVTVTGAASGQYTNTTGAVTSTNGGTGNTATANLTVATPPSITKAFGAASIPLNGTTSLTFTINNPNTSLALTGLAFTDNLPAGLVVATPSALNNTCGGTATATAGSGSVSLSAGTLAASASCTVTVNVTGTTAGVKNNSVTITSTEAGTGNTSNASITVVGAPTISKAFGAASIPLNGSTSLSFTITNASTVAQTGVAFSDTLPAGLVVSTPNGLTGTCGSGTITATAGSGAISLSGGTIAASSSCTFSVNVTGTTAGAKANTTGAVSSNEGGTGATSNTATINVVAPPSIAKAFNPAAIALNATTSLTFTITNPAANAVSLTGVAFTDTLPTGLTVANASATVCGGTLTVTAPTGISLTGATIAANSQCQFSVTVTGAAAGQYTNTTGAVTSTNGGTGNTASANLSVATPPSITKSFGAATIPVGGSTSLSFTINNPNTGQSLTGVAFTDSLPAGLVVSTPNGLTGTCGGGTISATAGATAVSLSGATLASSASCTFSVNVTGTTGGVKNNSVTVTATESGTGNTSNASITVTGPPTISKSFGAASIPLNGSTSLSFTIQNTNATVGATGVAFSDTLPAGLVVSTPNGLTGACGTGTVTATAGSGAISLTGGTIAANGSCTFSVNVTGTTAGTKNNTTGAVSSTEGGTGTTSNTATLNVVAPPSIAKAFNPTAIALNATTSLTFTITNPAANAVSLTGVAFTDTLPTGLTVASASATVCGGTVTTTAPTGISLTGATIAANGQCQFSVTVTGATAGQFTNTTGAVTSTNGGTGNTATANLSVAQAPQITKSFSPAAVPLNGTSALSFTINNPNAGSSLTGVAFTDTLPAGLVVSTPSGLTGSCGGGTITAAAGSGSVSLSGATLAASASCTLSVNVTPTTGGSKVNSVTVTSNESGAGNTSTATLTVTSPPTVTKSFGAASIPLNGTTTLTFVVTNPNPTVALTGIQFGDTLPAGLKIPTPSGLTGSCGTGTITPGGVSGFSTIGLTGGTLPAGGSCTFSVNVVGIAPGTQNNTTGVITSVEGGTGTTSNTATITVVAPPTIAKAFSPTAIAPSGVSTLTFTLTNPAANTVAEAGVAFTDTLPSGLVVATPNGLGGTCTGTATATAGSGSISFSGGSIATGSSCTVAVNVTGATAGTYTNTTGAVSSTNGGTGNTATAVLNIAVADLTITKTHVGVLKKGQIGANYTIIVKNSGAGPTVGTVTVVDTPPLFLDATAISGTGWTCTLSSISCTRSDSLAPGASYPPITVTTNIGLGITNSFFNKATVSGGGETNTSNDTAIDTALLGPPIILTPHSTTVTTQAGSPGTFVFDVEDDDQSMGLITFGCSNMPVGTSCTFSPMTTSAPNTTVTMTINTSGNGHSILTSQNSGATVKRSPFLAALLFPALGLVGIAVTGRKSKKNRLRLAMLLLGMMALLGFAGCGTGFHGLTTPAGSYQITVTAASTTTQVSTPVTLTVQ